MPNKKSKVGYIPIRTCVVCRGRYHQSDLCRFAVIDSEIMFDLKRRIPSRGYYVCNKNECLEKLNKWLLKNIHSVHHRIRNTCGINGNYMHWVEYVLTASLTLLGPILIGAHIYVIWIWVIIRQFEGADGHIGMTFLGTLRTTSLCMKALFIMIFIMQNSKAITRGFYPI